MKLSKKQKAVVDSSFENSTATCWNSIWKVLNDTILRLSGPDDMSGIRQCEWYRKLDDTQWITVRFCCQTGGLEPEATIADGIARRFWKDSPIELALRLAIGARFHSISTQLIHNSHADSLWRNILQSAAAHDWHAAKAQCQLWSESKVKPHNPSNALVCDGLTAIFNRDRDSLHAISGKLRQSKAPSYLKAVMSAIVAVECADSNIFNDSICQMLKHCKNFMFGDDLSSLIDVHAIGLLELSRRKNKDLANLFEKNSPLPWDAEYHEWLSQVEDIADLFEIPDVPQWLLKALFELEKFAWSPKRSPSL